MSLLSCGAVLLAASSSMLASHEVRTPTPRLERGHGPAYVAQQAEFYLSAQQVGYIRPGLKIKVESLQIPSDTRKPVVEVTFTDDLDQPLDRAGKVTPGPVSMSFIMARYDADRRDYVSYTTRVQKSPITNVSAVQASADSGGKWEDLAIGRARYTFATALPAGYDQTVTTTLGIYATRAINLKDPVVLAKTYYYNLLHDFRPDGGTVTAKWDAVADATCNSCHDPLALHGGARRSVKLCVLCHNETQSLDPDTGNDVQMANMVHKIHFGPNLENGYTIIGFNQTAHDYGHVTYPQDVRNCETCHRPTATEGMIWLTNPSRQACGSCHDAIDWETGEGHAAGPQADDSACASCHRPEGEAEFDASIKGAHTIPTESAQLRGVGIEILEVTGAAPGAKITVKFRTYNLDDNSFIPPSSLASLNFHLGGPTTDYASYFTESGKNATVAGETATYAFSTALPPDAAGTWGLSADVYRNTTLNPGPTAAIREAAQNPYVAVPVTDAQAVARRQVVDLAKCNACHNTLALHGGQRFTIEECLICHNPNKTDASRRPADKLPAETVHFKYMIHKIHTGEDLSSDLTIYGFGNTPHNYNEVLYPGDRRNCQACHKPGTYNLPVPEGSLPTITNYGYYTPTQPEAASCLSCHDSRDAAAHAWVNTAPFGESCAACHGVSAEFSVERAHAR
jgi:OmcA/MtrC family decaheme c-type cytochrome